MEYTPLDDLIEELAGTGRHNPLTKAFKELYGLESFKDLIYNPNPFLVMTKKELQDE